MSSWTMSSAKYRVYTVDPFNYFLIGQLWAKPSDSGDPSEWILHVHRYYQWDLNSGPLNWGPIRYHRSRSYHHKTKLGPNKRLFLRPRSYFIFHSCEWILQLRRPKNKSHTTSGHWAPLELPSLLSLSSPVLRWLDLDRHGGGELRRWWEVWRAERVKRHRVSASRRPTSPELSPASEAGENIN